LERVKDLDLELSGMPATGGGDSELQKSAYFLSAGWYF